MILLVTPAAVELSVLMGVLGWGQLISMIICWMGTIDLAVMKSPASSASSTEDMTKLMIWEVVRMYLLSYGMGSL